MIGFTCLKRCVVMRTRTLRLPASSDCRKVKSCPWFDLFTGRRRIVTGEPFKRSVYPVWCLHSAPGVREFGQPIGWPETKVRAITFAPRSSSSAIAHARQIHTVGPITITIIVQTKKYTIDRCSSIMYYLFGEK